MLRVFASNYIKLGEAIHDCRAAFPVRSTAPNATEEEKKKDKEHNERMAAYMRNHLERVRRFCEDLNLSVSSELVGQKLKNLPKTEEEFELLISAIISEQKTRLFLYVPDHQSSFFENPKLIDESVQKQFPSVTPELRKAANCFALGFYTAAVFHSVRAVEIGMREIAKSLSVSFSYPLEQANWFQVVNQIEAKIKEIGNLPKTADKDKNLNFYSEVAMQFRYFNDAWRVRASHAREDYDEIEARAVVEHANSFFNLVSKRLSESAA